MSPLLQGSADGLSRLPQFASLTVRFEGGGLVIYGDEALPGHYGSGVIRVTTDANGFYQFVGLAAGTYAAVEVQPAGVIDGIDTQGTTGGLAVNPIGAVNDPTTGHSHQRASAFRPMHASAKLIYPTLLPASSACAHDPRCSAADAPRRARSQAK